ncbi:hypothetical protein [Nocardia arizonensis]|uniref:hypothetical protein n=1 Tax=Nocardia arizonensis TaxID=1141647 RepID=UPI0006D25A68|nr:hypothetical protein [Nocardia arizonensis]
MVFGLPSFDSIVLNIGTLAANGPVGAMITGAADIDRSATALAVALGDQSPESIAARNRIKDLTDNQFQGEFHEPRIPESTFRCVRGEDLDVLYRKAQTIDVGAMTNLQQMWQARADKLEAGLNQFGPEILSAIAEKWEGAAAQSAAQGIVDYVNKARNMVSATKIVADKVEVVKSAVEVTKANVQPAPRTGWASTVASWIPGPTWKMDRDRTDAAELATFTVLEQVYQPGIREGDTGQPRIPLAYNPVQDTSVTSTGTGAVPSYSDSPSTPSSSPTGSGAAVGDQPADTPAASGDSGAGGDGQRDAAGPDSTTSAAGAGGSQSTTPAGADSGTPSSSGLPGSGAGSPNSGGWQGGSATDAPGSRGGSGISGGPGSAGGTGTPGRSVYGNPVGSARGTSGASAGGTAGRTGMSGAGGMAPGAGRGKDDEDREKGKSAIAEALVTRENGEELTGMDPAHRQPTVPPVLGE